MIGGLIRRGDRAGVIGWVGVESEAFRAHPVGVLIGSPVAGENTMSLAATILVWRATRAVRVANTRRRRELAAELADYSSEADRQDLEAILDRHPDGVTAEMRDILAHQRMWAAHDRSATSPFGRPGG